MPFQFMLKTLAKTKAAETGKKVWACDKSSLNAEGKTICQGAKLFLVLNDREAFQYVINVYYLFIIFQQKYASLYELLPAGCVCNLYFDFDMEFNVSEEDFKQRAESKGWVALNKEKLTPNGATYFARLALKTLKKHLALSFDKEKLPPDLMKDEKWAILQASYHILHFHLSR